MALCVKINNIKANNSYSIESFYKAIKDKHFSAGVPSLTKYGAASIITFPAIDSQNQVWIMKNGLSTESHKFSIQKSYEAGLDNIEKSLIPTLKIIVLSALIRLLTTMQRNANILLTSLQKSF